MSTSFFFFPYIGDFLGLFASLYQVFLCYLFGIPMNLMLVRKKNMTCFLLYPSLKNNSDKQLLGTDCTHWTDMFLGIHPYALHHSKDLYNKGKGRTKGNNAWLFCNDAVMRSFYSHFRQHNMAVDRRDT